MRNSRKMLFKRNKCRCNPWKRSSMNKNFTNLIKSKWRKKTRKNYSKTIFPLVKMKRRTKSVGLMLLKHPLAQIYKSKPIINHNKTSTRPSKNSQRQRELKIRQILWLINITKLSISFWVEILKGLMFLWMPKKELAWPSKRTDNKKSRKE